MSKPSISVALLGVSGRPLARWDGATLEKNNGPWPRPARERWSSRAVVVSIGCAVLPLPITMARLSLFPHAEVHDVKHVNPERGGSGLAVREV